MKEKLPQAPCRGKDKFKCERRKKLTRRGIHDRALLVLNVGNEVRREAR
jgi:hypothetical protein